MYIFFGFIVDFGIKIVYTVGMNPVRNNGILLTILTLLSQKIKMEFRTG